MEKHNILVSKSFSIIGHNQKTSLYSCQEIMNDESRVGTLFASKNFNYQEFRA